VYSTSLTSGQPAVPRLDSLLAACPVFGDHLRNVLADSKSPYYQRSFTIFLQGSYGNDTNVYRDSDVDIVIRLDDTYYYDNNDLGENQKASFTRAFSAATYGYSEFKGDVVSWLKQKFGDAVKPGTKAIAIKGNGTRRGCARLH
jgi:hypothetical protein